MCLLLTGLFGCKSTPAPQTEQATYPLVPEWHRQAVLYEVNLRHYTPEGTFAAFAEHVPRLKEMGVDILWFMPIHPISAAKRKGELGSPYAVADYYATNPDFGSLDDFRALVATIHAAGMRVIIDWVPNHSGWDNPWLTEHPDWYTQDAEGNIVDPLNPDTGESWGWTDVADFNFDKPEMRLGMIEAMKFWLTEVGIDGYRVDVAHGVPVDFWAQCRDSLYGWGPAFMLAEAAVPEIRNNGMFVADYAWEMHHLLNQIAKTQGANREAAAQLVQGNLVAGEDHDFEPKTALDIDVLLAKQAQAYTQGYAIQFTSNHDENAWAGTEFDRMGDGHRAFAVLTATFDGMPLIYSGQESAIDVKLPFFTKTTIEWGDFAYADFYRTLFELKHRNQALWNGAHGGPLVKVPTGVDEAVYAFTREKNGDKVLVIINLSAQEQSVALPGVMGTYHDVFAGEPVTLLDPAPMNLAPWAYRVLEAQ